MFSEQENRISQAAHIERWEGDKNNQRLSQYFAQCVNWAANYGVGEKPKIPTAVDYSVVFEPFSINSVETGVPLTDKTPESFLPNNFVPRTGSAEVGNEMKHAPGTWYFIGTGKLPEPGTENVTATGIKVKFQRSGILGLGGYWVRS